MLRELRVKNFAIIERLEIRFKPGLNVLTGETGAGKSILIGALGIALGERAYSEMIKTGAGEASVEAFFDIAGHPVLSAMGISSSEGFVLRRDILQTGKSRAYINDTMVSVQSLAEVGRTLVDIHGQHEHQSLLSPENQMRFLDRFGKLEGEREALKSLFEEVQALRRNIEGLRQNIRDRAQRVDLLRFQINEIGSAGLVPGEDASLEEEKLMQTNMGRLSELSRRAYEALYDSEGSCTEKLSSALASLREISSMDRSASDALGILESALPLIQEVSAELRDRKERYNFDPKRLEWVDDRLHTVKTLKKKYGDTIEAVLQYGQKAEEELRNIETSDERLSALDAELKDKEERLNGSADKLSEGRKASAGRLSSAIKPLLKELALEKADFRIAVEKGPLTSAGYDTVAFMFSANPGEVVKPLGKVASGGELSRVMLAIKSVLRDADNIPVLIFD